MTHRILEMELHRCEWTALAQLERCAMLIPWRGKMQVHCK